MVWVLWGVESYLKGLYKQIRDSENPKKPGFRGMCWLPFWDSEVFSNTCHGPSSCDWNGI